MIRFNILTLIFVSQIAFSQTWKLDTAISTSLRLPESEVANNLEYPVQLNEDLFIFQVQNRTDGQCLYVSDGTQSGTEMILRPNDIVETGVDEYDNNFKLDFSSSIIFDDKAYFFVRGDQGRVNWFWETDGSRKGTKSIQKLDFSPNGKFETILNELYFFANSEVYKLIDNQLTKFDFFGSIAQYYDISEVEKLEVKNGVALFKANFYEKALNRERQMLFTRDLKTSKIRLIYNNFPNTFFFKSFYFQNYLCVAGISDDGSFISLFDENFDQSDFFISSPIDDQEIIKYNAAFSYSIVDKQLFIGFARKKQFLLMKYDSETLKWTEINRNENTERYLSYSISIQRLGGQLIVVSPGNDPILSTGKKSFHISSFNLKTETFAEIGSLAFQNYSKENPSIKAIDFRTIKKISENELEIELWHDDKNLFVTTDGSNFSEIINYSKSIQNNLLSTFKFKGKDLLFNVNNITTYDNKTKKETVEVNVGNGGKRVNSVIYKDSLNTVFFSMAGVALFKNGKYQYLSGNQLNELFEFGNAIYLKVSYSSPTLSNSKYLIKISKNSDKTPESFFEISNFGKSKTKQESIIPFKKDAINKGKGYGRKINELGYIDANDNFTPMANIDSSDFLYDVLINNDTVYFLTRKDTLKLINGNKVDTPFMVTENNNFRPFGYQKIEENEFYFNENAQNLEVKNQRETKTLLSGFKLASSKYFYEYLYHPEKVTASFKGKFYFSAKTDAFGEELWVTDGTVENTKMLKDINFSSGSSYPVFMGEFCDRLYFAAFTQDKGQELYSTDGTPEGTSLEFDFLPGFRNSRPVFFDCQPNKLVVMAYTPEVGYQTWSKEIILSVTDQSPQIELQIYPNPASETLHFTIGNSKIDPHDLSIFNALGEQVFSMKDHLSHEINVKTLSPGVYFLIIKTSKGCIGKRFIKL